MENFFRRVILGVVALVACLVGVYAQHSSSNSLYVSWSDGDHKGGYELLVRKPHEIKVNLLSSTLLLHPEISYDYTFNTEISAGARTAFSFDAVGVPNAEMGRFQLSPYVRWHFYKETRRSALRGFFVEANMAYTYYNGIGYNPNVYYDNEGKMGYEISDKESDGSGFGLGIGLGYKWITRRAWTFELGGIVGRNIVHPGPAVGYGNVVFSIGKRF